MEMKSFLITIDTEGDNLWARRKEVTTKNASYIFRFQELCEKYSFKPTYLTNYEMANSFVFQELAHDIIKRKTGEIGMHLHAWDMPPKFQLTDNDLVNQPYLIEYPEKILREKIKIMTELLEDTFQIKILSHRAGRWAFNEVYAQTLLEYGYQVDCSVTPLISWEKHLGHPLKSGGVNYQHFPSAEYFLNINDISKPGNSSLLELPVTIEEIYPMANKWRKRFHKLIPIRKAIDYMYPQITWLRPNGCNVKHMLRLLDNAVDKNAGYVEFMLHSSEFMPGGSPTFYTKASIEKLYRDLDELFSKALINFQGATLTEYYNSYAEFCHGRS